MNLDEIRKLDAEYFMNTFGNRTNVLFEYGRGIYLYDENGMKYMDLLGGIAVNVLGHAHPGLIATICEQAGRIIHTSNLYYIKSQTLLAKKLCDTSCADKVFFANSGAEANEGAIKLARAYAHSTGDPEKYEIITLKNSFHGRTMATLSATGQPKYQEKFKPLNEGFRYVEKNDIAALEVALTPHVCAVMLELIQGESGVWPLSQEYVRSVRAMCDEKGILLILDEIQTGIGRTGKMFGYMNYDIEPDIITLAKGLGGGLPIGALLAKNHVAQAFKPGDHGSTFGGNHLATSAALCVLDTIISDGLLDNCLMTGTHAIAMLKTLSSRISQVRGAGLMIGIEFFDEIAIPVKEKLLELGYITGSVGTKIIRILPPLIITKDEIDEFCEVLASVLEDMYE